MKKMRKIMLGLVLVGISGLAAANSINLNIVNQTPYYGNGEVTYTYDGTGEYSSSFNPNQKVTMGTISIPKGTPVNELTVNPGQITPASYGVKTFGSDHTCPVDQSSIKPKSGLPTNINLMVYNQGEGVACKIEYNYS